MDRCAAEDAFSPRILEVPHLQDYADKTDTLQYSSLPDEAKDFIRIWRTQMLKMGLMPYVARTP